MKQMGDPPSTPVVPAWLTETVPSDKGVLPLRTERLGQVTQEMLKFQQSSLLLSTAREIELAKKNLAYSKSRFFKLHTISGQCNSLLGAILATVTCL